MSVTSLDTLRVAEKNSMSLNAGIDGRDILRAVHRSVMTVESFAGAQPETFIDRCFAELTALAAMIEDDPEAEMVRKLLFNSLSVLDRSSMHRRMRVQPLGYAGDYLLIDWIYTGRICKDPIGRHWDALFHRYPGVRAVMNRKDFLRRELLAFTGQWTGRSLRVLDLGCGSARDICEAVSAVAGSAERGAPVQFRLDCVDHEPMAIRYARRLRHQMQVPAVPRWICGNALKYRPEGGYDFIWSGGLFDYLNDELARMLIRRMWRWLNPGGQIVFGNFHPRNPTRIPMELCGGWFLIHRTEEDLVALVVSAGVPREAISVAQESLGVNLFCRIRK